MKEYAVIEMQTEGNYCKDCPHMRPIIDKKLDMAYCNVFKSRLGMISGKYRRCKNCVNTAVKNQNNPYEAIKTLIQWFNNDKEAS